MPPKSSKSQKVIEKKDSHKESSKKDSPKKDSHKEKDSPKKDSHKEKDLPKKSKTKDSDNKLDSNKVFNKETTLVGLNFNVKTYKAWLKSYYASNNRNVKILNAHYILAAVNEVLAFNLITGSSEMVQTQKTGLVDLTLERFLMYIQKSDSLLTTFSRFHNKYEANFDYSKLVPLDKKIFNKFVEKKCFHKNSNLNLSNPTMNYIFYLLAQVNINCAEIAFVFSQYAKKTTISGDGIRAAVQVLLNGKLLSDVMLKLESVVRILKNKSKKDSDKNEDKDEESDEDEKDDEKDNEDNDDEEESESDEESDED
jgi:hypothetical protein